MMNSYARYGIWGENPYGPSVADTAFKTNSAINDLFTQKNNLAMQQLQNQQAQQNLKLGDLGYQQKQMEVNNLPFQQDIANKMSQIGLNSAQSNFDYTPQQRAIAEQAARDKSNLENAQAAYARAQSGVDATKDPTAYFQSVLDKYNAAPQGSPQKLFFGHLLGNMSGDDGSVMSMAMPGGAKGAAGVNMAMGGAGGSTGAGGALNVPRIGPGDSIVNPGSISKNSNRGMSYSTTDSSGNPITYESPTMANSTANQGRLGAEHEISQWYGNLENGIAPYQGALGSGSVSLVKDSVLSALGNQNAKNRLNQLAIAQMIKPEVAGVSGRMTSNGGPVGIELVKQFENAQNKGVPANFLLNNLIPQSSLNYASHEYPEILKKGVNAAAEFSRQNNPVEMGETPQYAQTTPKKLSSFVRNAMTPEQIAQYEAQNSQVLQKQETKSNLPSYVTDDSLKALAAKNGITVDEARKRAEAYYSSKGGV